MPLTRVARIGIITASYARDIEAFAILRDSIKRFAPHFTHLAVIHHEDWDLFNKRFGHESHLTIISTAQVLPAALERKRRLYRRRWLKPFFKWVFTRYCSGWHFQQLSKIYTLAQAPFEAGLFLDSDCFLREPLDESFCFTDSSHQTLKLYRQLAQNAEQCAFDATTYRLFKKPLHQITQLYNYIYQPTLFYRRTAKRLLVELAKRSAWHYRFLSETMPSEYHLLGYCATDIENCEGYHIIDLAPDAIHHALRYQEDRDHLDTIQQEILLKPKPIVWVQSTLRLPRAKRKQLYQQILELNTSLNTKMDERFI